MKFLSFLAPPRAALKGMPRYPIYKSIISKTRYTQGQTIEFTNTRFSSLRMPQSMAAKTQPQGIFKASGGIVARVYILIGNSLSSGLSVKVVVSNLISLQLTASMLWRKCVKFNKNKQLLFNLSYELLLT